MTLRIALLVSICTAVYTKTGEEKEKGRQRTAPMLIPTPNRNLVGGNLHKRTSSTSPGIFGSSPSLYSDGADYLRTTCAASAVMGQGDNSPYTSFR
jgi:hypothetical protein